ncbi:hybrid sensor histidine kinase/response regulator [Acaryochloris sp. CCMEE 5410]|uniref:hybrid sensor histidine kinase/response regulator n=1 Tax=Acaryochloris sp. CCMEE 5410 TaxID=310037 RepID=UPI0002483A85|nr:hybrid sensor histidine kinase/response regulator [Acaryochloris sp. CCMEE 5410]
MPPSTLATYHRLSTMDKEQQVQFKFLEEAEDCYEKIERVLLGLATNAADPEQLDEALRASHSVKGGAAMMGLMDLSKVAHRLEDFFKILRVHHASKTIETEVETLLLQGLDCLRQVGDRYQQGADIDADWMAAHITPVFDQLQTHLGEVTDEDENALLSGDDEEVDPALLMFEDGVEAVLDRIEGYFGTLPAPQLAAELAMTAEELVAFGHMANLDSFIQLCQSIQELATQVVPEQIPELSTAALKTWRRSHALVLRRSFEKLPHELLDFTPTMASSPETDFETALDSVDLSALQADFGAIELPGEINLEDAAVDDLAGALGTDLPNPELIETDPIEDLAFNDPAVAHLADTLATDLPNSETLEEITLDDPAVADLADALATDLPSPEAPEAVNLEHIALDDPAIANLADALSVELPESALEFPAEIAADDFAPEDLLNADALANLQDSMELADLQQAFEVTSDLVESAVDSTIQEEVADLPLTLESAAQILEQTTAAQPAAAPVKPLSGKTVRVPVEQLEQFNTLFGKLILDRNTVNLRFEQLQAYTQLIRQRIRQLEASNTQLQQWYDRASMEGIVPAEEAAPAQPEQLAEPRSGQFDALEMDQYTDLHLIAQDQIETIVQLQEVGSDIELTLQDMGQAVRDINQTTRSLQTNVTRTQMVPFREIVKRFPRMIRDLSVQFNKPVNLAIEGDATLIDRAVLDPLGDALNHLLRNAFDHGIGSQERRISIGKTPTGTITIQARNRGAQTVITLSDDGAGIRLDKVRDRLQAMGIPEWEVSQLSEADLLDCIFEPGFSTADQVTEISGRGVGMDVVRNNLRDIRGEIQVHTEQSVGTTFTLSVPYTLSILRVMLLDHSGFIFAVPSESICELLQLQSDQIQRIEASHTLTWQDRTIPIINLAQHWAFNQTRRFSEMSGTPVINKPTILVVGEDDQIGGLEIERFWGEQEVTIRDIASPLPMPPGFVSSTVLGDGRVVPILDPLSILKWSLERQQTDITPPVESLPSVSSDNTILVVDDSVNVRRFLALTLEKAGYQVEQAKDGQEAVDKLESGLAVQAVVCDIEMPRLDGYGVLEEVKGQLQFEELPIVMLTSRSHEKHRKVAMNLGASAYFSKPFNEQELLDTLAKLIAQKTPELVG